ncbi:hypothetical protein [Deinococcus sp. NW-56]|uniref:hypothetical protein n=1 Tax=Deinococcus sp. NW-56 TaxID=2080419 RepID=UPI000CF47CE4|nr:hypothetical protein [Deinococcus sp. NW-56]
MSDPGKNGTGPQDNVPQEQVQDNPNWQTGTPKTPNEGQTDAHWGQVGDENADAGAGTPLTANPGAPAPSAVGGEARTPTTHGGMASGLPASGATTNPQKTVDGDEHS